MVEENWRKTKGAFCRNLCGNSDVGAMACDVLIPISTIMCTVYTLYAGSDSAVRL